MLSLNTINTLCFLEEEEREEELAALPTKGSACSLNSLSSLEAGETEDKEVNSDHCRFTVGVLEEERMADQGERRLHEAMMDGHSNNISIK